MNRLARIPEHAALWRGDAFPRMPQIGLPSGYAKLDAELPAGGWPTGVLIEILPAEEGVGELTLLMPALATLSARRPITWIAPPHLPYAPALMAAGIDLGRVLIVRADKAQDALWATEQALRSNACGAVLVWPHRPRFTDLRRLQIAAESGHCMAVLFRPEEAAALPSPAALRLGLSAHGGGLAVHILKRRGRPAARPVLLPVSLLPRHPHALDCALSAATAARDLRRPCA